MDLVQAYAVMGIEREATLDQAKKMYRARAVLLHPDRVDGSLRLDAERAMAQLNQAWDLVRQHLQSGSDPRPTSSADGYASADARRPAEPQQAARRAPVWGECDMCGYSPARPLNQWRITGMLIFWRHGSGTLDLCRTCGEAYSRESQAHCLVKGWWGVFAFWANLFVLARNWVSERSHRGALPLPTHRDPRVFTPFPGPVISRPLRHRPLPVLATVVAVGLMSWMFVIGGDSGTSGAGTREDRSPTAGVGTCLTQAGSVIDCSDTSAAYKLTAEVSSPDTCAADAFQDPDSRQWYCADRVG